MKPRFVVIGIIALLLVAFNTSAGLLRFSDSFENYQLGALDANLTPDNGGVNFNTNGGVNPWWGTVLPNLVVVTNEFGITPHSGTNMVRGNIGSTGDQDTDYYNLAYRVHGGNPYNGNVRLEWWFYDPQGPTNGDQLQDYVSLANYSAIPTNADYSTSSGVAVTGTKLKALSLGAGVPGASNGVYQAEVGGVTSGSYDGTGWFNTVTPRSIGWHQARINVSPIDTNGMVNVAFYIDDMVNPTLTNSLVSSPGFNCIQLNAQFGSVSAYYDDISFSDSVLLPQPTLAVTPAGTNIVLTFNSPSILQTSTNLSTTNWVDLLGTTSPYTNSMTDPQRFFRARNP